MDTCNRKSLLNLKLHNKYRKGRQEKDFEDNVFNLLRMDDHLCYHVSDLTPWYRYLDGIIDAPDWTKFCIEFKITDWYTFNMNQFEDSQVEYFEYFLKYWHEAYVMVYSTKTKTYWVGTYEYLKANRNSRWGVKLFEQC